MTVSPAPALESLTVTDAPESESPWGRRFALALGETAHFQIGPLRMWLERRPREWRLVTENSSDILARTLTLRCPDPAPEMPTPSPSVSVRRFATAATSGEFSLEPRLADRSVVVRPEQPLFLLPGTRVDVFVSSGLWLAIRLADGTELFERPIIRPSDTWFGPSALEGELCYASRTSARLDLDELPVRHHRAITRITLENRSRTPRHLVRLLLPAPELALHRFARDPLAHHTPPELWTQSCELVLDDSGLSPLRFRPEPPHAEGCDLVAPARRAAQRNLISRALEAIF